MSRALFRYADAAVLWLWNEWGVPWRKLVSFLLLAGATIAMAQDAQANGYHLGWWVRAAIYSCGAALLVTMATFMPAAALNAANSKARMGILMRLWRASQIGFLIADLVQGSWRIMIATVAILIGLTAFQTLCPTGPRKPRRRESTVLRPAPVRC